MPERERPPDEPLTSGDTGRGTSGDAALDGVAGEIDGDTAADETLDHLEVPDDVDPADAYEQAQVVDYDEDDYR